MENSSSQNYVRIENSKFGNRGIICTSGMFFLSFAFCVIIGATGPNVIQSRNDSVSILQVDDNGNAEWIGSVNDMLQLNQLFWISVIVYRPSSLDDDIGVIETFVNVTGYDSLGGDVGSELFFLNRHAKHSVYCAGNECSEFYVFGQSSIRYRRYDLRIRFSNIDPKFLQSNDNLFEILVDLHTINSEYSKFELGWKAFFGLTTLLVLFLPQEGFFIKLYFIPHTLWSFEQTWVLGLLLSLLFFNDPLFAAQLYTEYSDSFAILYIFFTCTFAAILLLFWLSVLDEMRVSAVTPQSLPSILSHVSSWKGDTRRQWQLFYVPKLALVSIIWAILISTFVYIRTERKGDPTYEGLDDWVLRNAEVALVALLFLYIFWLFILLVLNFSRIVQLSSPFKFLFAVTVCIYCIVFTGLFAGYFYPLSTSAVVFLCFYALINFYVWVLAFAFAPLGTDEGYTKAITTFGEDYFDEIGHLQCDIADDML